MGKKSRKKKQIEKRIQAKRARRAKKSKMTKSSQQHLTQKRGELFDDRLPDIATITDMPGNKISEAILDFAYPLLERCQTPEEEDKALTIAIIAWNVCLLPEEEADSFIENMCKELTKDDDHQGRAAFDEIMEYLVSRKKEFFDHDKRLVVNYEITHYEDRLHLQVAAEVSE